jgi:hypothetical protein
MLKLKKNKKKTCLQRSKFKLGQGGFGPVYKVVLEKHLK